MRYLLTGLFGLFTIGIFYSCQKELSVEYSSAAKGSLQSSAGDCLPKTVGGAYVAAKALIDSNFIDVTVTVTAPGPYTIFTDTLNGYAFKATGTFATTGPTTVRLKGSGTPAIAGTDDFTVYFDSSYCDVAVTVLPAGSSGGAAVYNLGGAGGACTPFTPSGNYIKDTTLDGRHFVTVTLNVTAVGTYAISTNTVNGYFFSASGTFGATGTQTITLNGSGKPVAAGTDAFTVTGGTSTCSFTITVTATAPVGCNPNVQGTYTAATAATATNKVTLTHTYAAAGTYTVSTNTVNGYSFGPSPVTATAGTATTITLTATGTPAAAGTDNFTVSFGDGQTCSFSVTVIPGTVVTNTDYFPTTQGSYWTYDDGAGADTFKVTVNGTAALSGNTYQKFNYTGFFTGVEYYRKDPVSSFYFQSLDTAGTGAQGVSFNQARLDLLFMKNTLSGGATWNSDFACTVSGFPSKLRFKYTCVDATSPKTVNGKTFTNVYKIQEEDQVDFGNTGNFQVLAGPFTYYYAKGIGLIAAEDENGDLYQAIRYWVVN